MFKNFKVIKFYIKFYIFELLNNIFENFLNVHNILKYYQKKTSGSDVSNNGLRRFDRQ